MVSLFRSLLFVHVSASCCVGLLLLLHVSVFFASVAQPPVQVIGKFGTFLSPSPARSHLSYSLIHLFCCCFLVGGILNWFVAVVVCINLVIVAPSF